MTESQQLDAGLTAEKIGELITNDDKGARHMGIILLEISPGVAIVRLRLEEHHMNHHNTCHGGVTFMLADTAFAYACNSHDQKTVGLSCSINYMKPAFLGDILIAEAREESKTGRTGVYNVTVTNQDKELISVFRGQAYSLKETVL